MVNKVILLGFERQQVASQVNQILNGLKAIRIEAGKFGVEGEDIIVHRIPLATLTDQIAEWRAQGYAMDVKLLLLLGAGMMA